MTIRFSCICDHRFDLPVEQAGSQLQCPKCMRLVDVPQLNELGAFEEDGTLRMGDSHENESALRSKVRAFAHREDLRADLDTFLNIGTPITDPKPTKPRYDPITGDLVRLIEVQADAAPPPQEVPLARPVISYGTGATEPVSLDLKWWQMPWRLLQGHSLMAMSFVFAAHVLVALFLILPIANFFVIPAVAVLAAVTIAHFGNVIDHIGPQNHDDVPVMLRGVSFSEDIWQPFAGFLLATLLCFGPALAIHIFVHDSWLKANPWAVATALGVGIFIFPAAFMTATASGAVENLWPPRVLRVILAAPIRYVLALVAFLVGIVAYYYFLTTLLITSTAGLIFGGLGPSLNTVMINTAMQTAAALIATYALHLSTAWLAIIYRTHHAQFHWVLQSHTKRPREDTLARLQAMRRNGDPRVRPTPRPQVRAAKLVTPVQPAPVAEAIEVDQGLQDDRRGFEVNIKKTPKARPH
jgi:hypothetical protein